MFIFYAILGLILFIAGIILKKRSRKKAGKIIRWVGVLTLIISVLLFIGTLLLIHRDDPEITIGGHGADTPEIMSLTKI